MARASITGQPVHLQSPLVPAILLLVSLANVNLGDHHRKVLWRAAVVSLAMLAVGVLVGSIPCGLSRSRTSTGAGCGQRRRLRISSSRALGSST